MCQCSRDFPAAHSRHEVAVAESWGSGAGEAPAAGARLSSQHGECCRPLLELAVVGSGDKDSLLRHF